MTTGRTVEEARERALAALGIDEDDLEFEVLAEPARRLFGLRRTEARVRARVRPTRPRPKVDRRTRRKTSRPSGGARKRRGGQRGAGAPSDPDQSASPGGGTVDGDLERDREPAEPGENRAVSASGDEPHLPTTDPGSFPAPDRRVGDDDDDDRADPGRTGATMTDITLDEQEPSATGFVRGLVAAFGVEAEITAEMVDEENLEISVTGTDLGLLVGPRGTTLQAIQELTRTAVAQQHSGRLAGRLRVDVAGYRARRQQALERFALEQAARVQEAGVKIALEPMPPPDRKIIHDVINGVEGVRTESEGEERLRHVVILPD